jgi:hypothetical protein
MELNWLHLSDIHFVYQNYATIKMRYEFLNYLKQINKAIDFIVISGDITYKNLDYNDELNNFLKKLIEICGLNKEDLYLVPGNHDVQRGGPRGHIIETIIKNENPFKELDELDFESYNLLLAGQKKFFDFYQKFYNKDYPIDMLHYISKKKDYNIININTCLISGFDGEEGKLLLNHTKLFKLLEREEIKDDNKLNIAIGHHDFDCLYLNERKEFEHILSTFKIDIYLSGHYHKASYNLNINNPNDFNNLVVGSHIIDGYSVPCFSIGKLDLNNGHASVKYHRWYIETGCWDFYSGLGGKSQNGEINFIIKKYAKHEKETQDTTEEESIIHKIRIIQIKPEIDKKVYESTTGRITFGRNPNDSNVLFSSLVKGISWEHGLIVLLGETYYYHHLSNSSHTIINSKNGDSRLLKAGEVEKYPLRNQDHLILGEYEFVITFDIIGTNGSIWTPTLTN